MPGKSRRHVLKAVHEQREFAATQIYKGMSHWRLPNEDRLQLESLLFGTQAGVPVLGNQLVRLLAIEAMIDVVRGAFGKRNRQDVYLITFCLDEGMTWEYVPVVDLVKLGRKIDKAMRRMGVSGVGAFEIESFRPIAGDAPHGRRFWTHAHVLARSKPRGFDHVAEERAINALPSFSNCLGAKPIDIKPVAPTGRDFTRVAAYLFEYRHHTKLIRRAAWGGKEIVSVRRGFEPPTALRLAELESQIALPDLVFGVGRIGIELRKRWKLRFEELRSALPGSAAIPSLNGDVPGLWARSRSVAGNGSRRYQPCKILTRSRNYRDRLPNPRDK